MPFKAPVTEKCEICTKSVYAQERQEAGEKIYHKLCFKCKICKKTLNLNNYKQADGFLYCPTDFAKEILAKNTQVAMV